MISSELIFIAGFIVFICLMLALDLGLFGKSDKPVSIGQAALMSGVWVALALVFYGLIYQYGHLFLHIDNYKALQYINIKNFHHLQGDPGGGAAGRRGY